MTDKKWREWHIAEVKSESTNETFLVAYDGKPAIDSWILWTEKVIQIEAYQELQKKLEIAREALKLIHKDLDAYFVSPTAVRLIAEAEKALKELEDK